jgi:uncharacterized pyridoxal phosphate-containing UPF0001 family protein
LIELLKLAEKNGVEPEKVVDLYQTILSKCENLDLVGIMTIGSLDASVSKTLPNKDFQVIRRNKDIKVVEITVET